MKKDGPPKSSTELIRTLVNVVSRGGNLLLNVGPKPNGEIPEPLAQRLRDIGVWLAKNGEGIYGTRQVKGIMVSDGKLTAKGNRLFIHLETRPGDTVTLTGLDRAITEVSLLATGKTLTFDNTTKTIQLPEPWDNAPITTIAIELK